MRRAGRFHDDRGARRAKFRTIANFRKRHLPAPGRLLLGVEARIKANASKHKAMSYKRMKRRETELRAEVDPWLEAAEAADTEVDTPQRKPSRRRNARLDR
jgi:hypothetical protein